MANNLNNLNLVNNNDQNFSHLKLSRMKKEAIIKFTEINQNILCKKNLKVYNVTIEKTKEMMQNFPI